MSELALLAHEFVMAFLGALERCASRAAAALDPVVQAARRNWREVRNA